MMFLMGKRFQKGNVHGSSHKLESIKLVMNGHSHDKVSKKVGEVVT